MSVEENKALIRRYAEEFNRRNDAFLEEYFGPGYVYHGSMGDWDKQAFIEFHNSMLAAFPDAEMTIRDQVAEGDKVVTRLEVRGTHRGEFQGIAPTGRDTTTTGIIISRFEQGRVVEEWEELNMLGLMQQIGAIPAPAEA